MVSEKLRKQAISWFKQKYRNAKVDKFEVGYNLDNSGKLKSVDALYKISPNYKDYVLITDKRFLINEMYKNDLYGSKFNTERIATNINKDLSLRFPKMWQTGGTTQEMPESNIQYIEGYQLTYKYAGHYILDYPIENFRVYVNENDYF